MDYLKTIAVILISVIGLSGCAGRGSRIRQIKQIKQAKEQEQKAEMITPLTEAQIQVAYLKTANQKNVQKKELNALTSLPHNSYLVDQDKSFEIAISEYGYTRFSIEDERITDVFIHPQENILIKIHDQGYLIVVPKELEESLEDNREIESNINNDKVYVTITGEHGTTQDFSLRFTGKSPEPVKFIKSNLGTINLNKGD
jgi:hypothetical protein